MWSPSPTDITTPADRLAAARTRRLAELAARRWQAESAGILVAGARVATDTVSQGKLTAAALAAVRDPAYTLTWKCADGAFVALDAPRILALADAARAYVQAAFDREAVLADAIAAAASQADLAAIDLDAGWPADA